MFLPLSSYAQLTYGVKGGLNLANFAGEDANEDSKMKLGANLGLTATYELTSLIGVKAEMLYSMQGAAIEYSENIPLFGTLEYTHKTKLNYLSIPVLANATFGSAYINAGPAFNFLVASDDEFELTSDQDNIDIEDYVGDYEVDYVKNDISFVIGGGYNVGNIFLEVRYNAGLKSISEDNLLNQEIDIKNSVIQFSVGYNF